MYNKTSRFTNQRVSTRCRLQYLDCDQHLSWPPVWQHGKDEWSVVAHLRLNRIVTYFSELQLNKYDLGNEQKFDSSIMCEVLVLLVIFGVVYDP